MILITAAINCYYWYLDCIQHEATVAVVAFSAVSHRRRKRQSRCRRRRGFGWGAGVISVVFPKRVGFSVCNELSNPEPTVSASRSMEHFAN